jgi:hypothetical protein
VRTTGTAVAAVDAGEGLALAGQALIRALG